MKRVVIGIITRLNEAGDEEYLLVAAKKDFGMYTDYYYPPGGHCENGEDEQTTLKREIEEETGLRIKPTQRIAETDGDVPGQRTAWWHCEVVGGSFAPDVVELADACYCTRQQMETMNIFPATKRLFAEYIYSQNIVNA